VGCRWQGKDAGRSSRAKDAARRWRDIGVVQQAAGGRRQAAGGGAVQGARMEEVGCRWQGRARRGQAHRMGGKAPATRGKGRADAAKTRDGLAVLASTHLRNLWSPSKSPWAAALAAAFSRRLDSRSASGAWAAAAAASAATSSCGAPGCINDPAKRAAEVPCAAATREWAGRKQSAP